MRICRRFIDLRLLTVPAVGAIGVWSLFVVAPASARTLAASGQVSLVSRYVDDDLSVYARGPSVQPELTFRHDRTGCYGDAWGSYGLSDNSGDELELTVGCERTLSPSVRLEISAAEYIFRSGSWSVLSVSVSSHGLSLRGNFYRPNYHEAPGVRLVGSYARTWNRLSLAGSLTYDSGSQNGTTDLVAGGLRISYAATARFGVSASVQVPLSKRDSDERRTATWAAVTYRF